MMTEKLINMDMYKLNSALLSCKTSRYAKRKSKSIKNLNMGKEVFPFFMEGINTNFFIRDKNGNYIYKSNELSDIVRDIPTTFTYTESWAVSMDKQTIVEEKYNEKDYLVNKVDITDKKKTEKLLKLQEEFYTIAKEVAHDISSPVSSLKIIQLLYKDKLSEKDKKILDLAVKSIENMANKLLSKYMSLKKLEEDLEMPAIDETEELYVDLFLSLTDLVTSKRYQYAYSKLKINYYPDENNKFVFMKGYYFDFERMISNLIKNSVDAMEGKKGAIDISYVVKDDKVEIRVKDNGKGMPKEMADKIMANEEVGTTKENGHGIGLQQVRRVLKEMNGKVLINTKESVGTEFILTFPKSEHLESFANKIE